MVSTATTPNPGVQAAATGYGRLEKLGAALLEAMDWHISPSEKKLVPNPGSPEGSLLPLC